MPPYTNAEAGLRSLGRAPRPSPCTRCVWVPRTVPRAACTPATPRRPCAVISRRPHARRRPSAVLRPCRGPHLVWPQLGAQANNSTASSRPYKPSFSTRVSTQPPPPAIGAVPVNSISGYLSSRTRAASNSTRVPSTSPLRVLLRPSR
jgi:hypothetical protein